MILRIKISLVFFFCFAVLGAQESVKDSIFIFEKMESIERNNLSIDSSLVAFEEVYFFSKKIDFKNGYSQSLIKLGQLHFKNNQPSLALRYFTEAITFFEKEKELKKLRTAQIAVSEIYLKEGLPERAIEYLYKAGSIQSSENERIEIVQKLAGAYLNTNQTDSTIHYLEEMAAHFQLKNQIQKLIKTLGTAADIYNANKKFNKELVLRKRILSHVEKGSSIEQIAVATNNVGYAFHNLKDYENAVVYFEKTEELNPNDEWLNLPMLYTNLGVAYFNLDEIKKSNAYFKKALKLVRAQKNDGFEAYLEHLLANVYLRKKDYYSAVRSVDNAIEKATKEKDFELLVETYRTASLIHEKLFNFEKTLSFYQKHLSLRDSFQLEERVRQQEVLQQQILLEKAEKEIKLLLANQEFQELTIRQLETEKEKLELASSNFELDKVRQEQQLALLKQEQEVQAAELQNRELAAQRAKQDLLLAAQELEASKKDKAIADLTIVESQQRLELAEKAAAEKERLQQIEMLERDKEIQDLEIDRQNQFRRFAYGLGTALAAILGLILLGLLFARRTNKKLAAQNEEIEKQKGLVENERDKSDQLLLNILPAETAEELKNKGFATPKTYEQVSVLFTDFTNFTEISDGFAAEKVIEELNICFQKFDEIIEKHNLEKIKTIGDSYMVTGGIPTANRTNSIDAVKAAIKMQDFIEERYNSLIAKGETYWRMRVGIHTGPAVAGVIGAKKFAYDIWGDTVNTASRMESSCEPGRVNISEATYDLVKNKFNCTSRGEIEVKGKGKVGMYFVEV